MKQLAGDDALVPFCFLIAPRCSFGRTSLFVGLVNHVKPHTTFLTLDSSGLVEGRFSWPRGTWSSWRSKLISQQGCSLPVKAINKSWSKSPLKNVCSSQKGAAVADAGLIPPCWYKLCTVLSGEGRGKSCSEPHKSDSFPYSWQLLLSHTRRLMKSSSAKWCCHRSEQFKQLLG